MMLPLPEPGDGIGSRTMVTSCPKSSNHPPPRTTKVLRTYSKRVNKPSIECSEPLQDTLSKAINIQAPSPSKSDVLPPPNPKKRSISDFFRPISSNPRSSSPALSHRQSSPIPSSPQTVPSSPPSLYSQDEKENEFIPKKRAPRRLNSKPQFTRAIITDNMANQKMDKVEKIGVENTGEYELEDMREQARSASLDQALVTTASKIPESAFLSSDRGRGSTFGARNVNNPGHAQVAAGSAIAPTAQNTGGALGNLTVPDIVVGTLTTPTNIPDGGASTDEYKEESPRLQRPLPMKEIEQGMLSAPSTLDPGEIRSPGSDRDAASIRSARSLEFIGDLVGGEMSDLGDTPPNTDGASQRRRRMTETEVSLAMPVSAGRKSRRNRSSMGFDGACDDGAYEEAEDDDTLKRKREASSSSIEVAQSADSTKKDKKVKLSQTTLNFGQTRQPSACDICNFLKQTCSRDEEAEHQRFHNQFLRPIICKADAISGAHSPQKAFVHFPDVKALLDHGSCIVAIDNRCAQKWKDAAEAAIKKAERDIGALTLDKSDLWDNVLDVSKTTKKKNVQVPRFKVFLAVKQNYVLSLLVAERVFNARVVSMLPSTMQGELEVGENDAIGEEFTEHAGVSTEQIEKVEMGVHYVWTHEDYRRCGVASKLLNFARNGGFMAGAYILRGDVAWTDPTEAGKAFHRAYVTNGEDTLGNEWEYLTYESV